MIIFTVDTDWAPDFMIDFLARYFIETGTKSTWFITHDSPAIDKLKTRPDLFEIGIHPNFYPGSTHGETMDQILDHCLGLVPEAVSMRSHGLYQSSNLWGKVLAETAIRYESSIYLPHWPGLMPIEHWWQGKCLVRFPLFFEDDLEFERPAPCWQTADYVDQPGLRIFNFHPVHVFLNSHDTAAYEKLRRTCLDYKRVDEKTALGLRQSGKGALTLFTELLHASASGSPPVRMKEIYALFQSKAL